MRTTHLPPPYCTATKPFSGSLSIFSLIPSHNHLLSSCQRSYRSLVNEAHRFHSSLNLSGPKFRSSPYQVLYNTLNTSPDQSHAVLENTRNKMMRLKRRGMTYRPALGSQESRGHRYGSDGLPIITIALSEIGRPLTNGCSMAEEMKEAGEALYRKYLKNATKYDQEVQAFVIDQLTTEAFFVFRSSQNTPSAHKTAKACVGSQHDLAAEVIRVDRVNRLGDMRSTFFLKKRLSKGLAVWAGLTFERHLGLQSFRQAHNNAGVWPDYPITRNDEDILKHHRPVEAVAAPSGPTTSIDNAPGTISPPDNASGSERTYLDLTAEDGTSSNLRDDKNLPHDSDLTAPSSVTSVQTPSTEPVPELPGDDQFHTRMRAVRDLCEFRHGVKLAESDVRAVVAQ